MEEQRNRTPKVTRIVNTIFLLNKSVKTSRKDMLRYIAIMNIPQTILIFMYFTTMIIVV